ncbi:MAG: hypothetical protein Q9218_004454 [Villophora microphyllina]
MAVPKSILVIGAGELGLPVLHSLSHLASTFSPSSRPTITALFRPSTLSSPSSSQSRVVSSLHELNVQFLAVDIASSTASELATYFRKYETIISYTGFSGGPGTQLKLAQAVLEAGVYWYYPWQFGVDYDIIGPEAASGLFREQCDVRQLLRGQTKTKWTIISTGMFTTFLFEPSFGVIDKVEKGSGKEVVVRALGGWDNKVSLTTPDDIGKVVADLVLRDLRTGVVFTAGDTVSYGQLADAVEEKVGKEKVRRQLWSLEHLQTELERDPENGIKRYRVIFAEGRGVSWEKPSTVNEERGITTTDLKSFVASKDTVVNEH